MADTDLIERLNVHAASWRRDDAFKARDPEAEAAIADEAATALAEKDARIAELEAAVVVQRESKEYAQRCCITAETALTASRAECEGLRETLVKAKAFHDRDAGCNGFTADYEILRYEIDASLSQPAKGEREGDKP